MKKIVLYASFMFISGLSLAAAAGEMKAGFGHDPALPKPFATAPVKHFSKVIGWPEGVKPKAPEGFKVTLFASGLNSPRWMYQLPDGGVLVSEATGDRDSPDNIILLRDDDGNGVAEKREVFLEDLDKPFGMAVAGPYFYVAEMEKLLRFPFEDGKVTHSETKLLDLPAGGYNNHWTRNLLLSRDGKKFYITVGSGSNDGEEGIPHEHRRANILEVALDGTGEKVIASGVRNPVGMDFEPETGKLWTAVNERDNLGDDLVPDYFTGVTEGGFYGWPYYYFGKNPDPHWNIGKPESDLQVIKPDYALGSHTASLGLAFYTGAAFPAKYHGGAFIGQHGSWNRSQFAGYKVIYVPFKDGKPSGPPEDFLTGFMKDTSSGEAYGRPVGVTVLKDGALLVADDGGNAIWRVAAESAK